MQSRSRRWKLQEGGTLAVPATLSFYSTGINALPMNGVPGCG